jgi:hypothetical protein
MNVIKRVIVDGKAQVNIIKSCSSYRDLEDIFLLLHKEKKLNFLPFKHYKVVKDFFDSCLIKESISTWDLEISFLKWKKDNNLKSTGIRQLNYYLIRGYSKKEATELIREHQVTNSNTNKATRISKTVKTKHKNNLYTAAIQSRGRSFYTKKGFTLNEVEQIISKRNQKWLQSIQKAIQQDPTINKRKGRSRQQLIDTYGYTKACDIISSRLTGSISTPEIFLRSVLSAEWTPQWFINNGMQFYIYDFVNKKAKIILEFNGDIWHANPQLYTEDWINPVTKKTAKEIWMYDNEKRIAAEVNGYKLIVLWENDFKELRYNNEAVKNKLYELTQGNV